MSHSRSEIFLGSAMLALAPILLCEGKYVRLTTPKLPEASGPRSGISGQGPPLSLLILGDSAAAGVGVASQDDALAGRMLARMQDFRVTWKVDAQTGATTRSTIARLKMTTAGRPPEQRQPFNVVAIALGVNDVTCGTRVSRWIEELNELAGLLRSRFGTQHMLWSGLPPMHQFPCLPQPLRWFLGARARMFDQVLKTWTERQPDCEFVSAPLVEASCMAADGFHPGPKIYLQWAGEMVKRVRNLAARTQLTSDGR